LVVSCAALALAGCSSMSSWTASTTSSGTYGTGTSGSGTGASAGYQTPCDVQPTSYNCMEWKTMNAGGP
jgi:hypothetical protein